MREKPRNPTLKKKSLRYIGSDANSKPYLDNIMELIPYYIFWKNTDSVYLGCNKLFASLLGKTPAEVVGQTDFSLGWSDGEPELFIAGDKETLSDLVCKINIEEQIIRSDGSRIVMLVSKVPLKDQNGRLMGVLGISTDITERKKMEEALELAKNQAQAASSAKSDFIANMSHDVKTPLSGIMGMADILSYKLKDADALDFVHSISKASQALMKFSEDCIDVVRSENSEVLFKKEHFRLRLVLTEVYKLSEPAARNKGLFFVLDYPQDMSDYFIGSRIGIYRILLNLVGNAIKFTEKGGVTIRVSLVNESLSGKQAIVKMTIEDTGIGIPEDKCGAIFERYKRLYPSYEGVYEGMGIGLDIVKRFLNDMNGEVYVTSRLGEGSCFSVILPLDIPLLEPEEYQLSCSFSESFSVPLAMQSQGIKKMDAAKLCILVVEDNIVANKIMQSILIDLNCDIEVAGTGKQSCELFSQKKYDLIFMDIGLPDMLGYVAIQKMRAMEIRQHRTRVPIVMLTAHATKDVEVEFDKVGADAIFSKPLHKIQVQKILNQYVYSGCLGNGES